MTHDEFKDVKNEGRGLEWAVFFTSGSLSSSAALDEIKTSSTVFESTLLLSNNLCRIMPDYRGGITVGSGPQKVWASACGPERSWARPGG